jgi:3-oxoacyl-[acyl-carrier-protein] synthase II
MAERIHRPLGETLVISGASGAHAATGAELDLYQRARALAPRAFSTRTGHLKEAQFPFAVALAALAIHNGAAYPPFDADAERPVEATPDAVLATTIGYHVFEGMALVAKP